MKKRILQLIQTKKIIRELCANKLNNLQEMDKFLETYNPLGMNHEEIHSLNRLSEENAFYFPYFL